MEVASDDPGDNPTNKVDVIHNVNLAVCTNVKAKQWETDDG